MYGGDICEIRPNAIITDRYCVELHAPISLTRNSTILEGFTENPSTPDYHYCGEINDCDLLKCYFQQYIIIVYHYRKILAFTIDMFFIN